MPTTATVERRKLRMNHEVLRNLEAARKGAAHIHTAALTPPCLKAVRGYIEEWVLAPLDAAIAGITGQPLADSVLAQPRARPEGEPPETPEPEETAEGES